MKNKLLKIIKSISIIFLILCFPIIFFSIINLDINNISNNDYIIYLTLANLILTIIFIFIYKDTLKKDIKNFKNNLIKNIELGIKYWIIGFIIMLTSNLIITLGLNKELAGNEQIVRNYIDLFPSLMIFNTVIYAPITEELAFRKSIKDAITNKWIYVITSGLIFGLLHISSYITNWTDLIYLIPYSSLGIAFALLYHKTNNIFSTITMHALHNLLTITLYLIGASLWKKL